DVGVVVHQAYERADEAVLRDRVLAVLEHQLVQLVRPWMERDLQDRDLEAVDRDGLEDLRVGDVLGLGAEPALLSELSCLHRAPPPLRSRAPPAGPSRSPGAPTSAGTAARRSAGTACARTSPRGGGPRRPTGRARPA